MTLLITSFFSITLNFSKRLLFIKYKQYIETRILKSISCYIEKYPRIFFLFNLILEILFFINLFQVLLGSSFFGIFFFIIRITLFPYIKSLPLYKYINNYILGMLRNLYTILNNSLNTKI